MRPLSRRLLLPALLLAACGGQPQGVEAPAPGRIVGYDENGAPVRSYTDERTRATFAAPSDRVFAAVSAVYTQLGIPPTVNDPAARRYGNAGFVVPKNFMGNPLGEYFRCGDDVTGPLVNRGRLFANMMTTLDAVSPTSTVATTVVTGRLQRSEGVASTPITCASTGKMEELLRKSIMLRLATTP